MARPVIPHGDEYRSRIREGLAAQDWRSPYEWAKSWVGSGGGAQLLDPWLAYVASAMLKGEPRTAVHAIDLALKNWIPDKENRAVLLWVRSRIVRVRLKDPRSALTDLRQLQDSGPEWLQGEIARDSVACGVEAERSRKRKPSVQEAPDYVGTATPVAPPTEEVPPGSIPALWPDVRPFVPDAPSP